MKVVACPNCDMKYRLDPAKFSKSQLRIRCKNCQEAFQVDLTEGDQSSPPPPPPEPPQQPAKQEAPPPPPSLQASAPAADEAAGQGTLVVVGHDVPEVRDEIRSLLQAAGYRVEAVDNGIDALLKIEQQVPRAAVLDVALPKMFGFEVCEVVRRDPALKTVRLLLIAAIYDHQAYKRTPSTLYGADDYVEKHLIPQELVPKVSALLGDAGAENASSASDEREPAAQPPPAPPQSPSAEAPAAEPPQATQSTEPPHEKTPPSFGAASEDELKRARRLARTIISDIALYNEEPLAEGIRENDVRGRLKDELDEGLQLLNERAPDTIENVDALLDEALDDFVANKRKELGLDS